MKHKIAIVLVLLLILTSTLLLRDSLYFKYILISIIALFGFTISIGVLFMKFNYFLVSRTKSSTSKVILSFDDGPNSENTPLILSVLKKYSVGAIFFVIGEKAENNPEILKQIHTDGHIVGNHTYSHPNLFSAYSAQKVMNEIAKCDEVIESILNEKPKLFRPPIGYTNPIIARVLRKLNKQAVGWELRSYDTVLKNPTALKDRLLKLIKPSQIILLHDNLDQSAQMLDEFIDAAKKNGIIFANTEDIQKLR